MRNRAVALTFLLVASGCGGSSDTATPATTVAPAATQAPTTAATPTTTAAPRTTTAAPTTTVAATTTVAPATTTAPTTTVAATTTVAPATTTAPTTTVAATTTVVPTTTAALTKTTSTPTTAPPVTAVSLDPAENGLGGVEACKLPNESGNSEVHAGFPRSANRIPSQGVARVAVLFVDFPNAISVETTEELFNINVPWAETYLEAMSYGDLDLQFEPLHTWLRMSETHGSYGFSGASQSGPPMTFEEHRAYIQEAVVLADPNFDFEGIDSVLIIADPKADSMHSPGFVANDPYWGVRADGLTITSGVTRGGDYYDIGQSGNVVAHEMGHTLGLSDLFETGLHSHEMHRSVGNFGIMGLLVPRVGGLGAGQNDPLAGNEMLAWHRWQLDWVDSSQIACVTTFPRSVQLSPVANKAGIKAAVVPANGTKAIVIENRQQVGYDLNLAAEGVLVYTVDTTMFTGTGALVVQGSFSGDWPDSSVFLQPGETLDVEGYEVSVISALGEDYLTEITVP